MKKICIIGAQFFPIPAKKGGASEQLVTHLINYNEIKQKIDITCVSIFDKEAYEASLKYKYTKFIFIDQEKKKDIFDCEATDENFLSYIRKIKEKIKDLDFDYIIINSGNARGYKELLDLYPHEKRIFYYHEATKKYTDFNDIYKNFIVVSDYVKNKFIQGDETKSDNVRVLKNCIDLDNLYQQVGQTERDRLRKKYKIDNNDIVVSFCGRLHKDKGVKELIMAFKQIKNIKNSKLLIIGNANFAYELKTKYDYELEKEAENYEDKIIFTGFIPNDKLYEINSIADIAVVPSLCEEAFCLVLAENMASGLPIIITDSGAMPEISGRDCVDIVKRDKDLINNISKQLDYLIENKEIRLQLGKKAKEFSKQYGIKEYYNNFVNIIENLNKC